MTKIAGTLYIVATPIGNLEDITFRAIRVLKEADIIAAEDTRHSRRLLNHYGITTRLISCHEHNEEKKAQDFISMLGQGLNIALISDAGTPLISDPGFRLVKAVSAKDIPVIPIPGCNAAIAGLSVAGLPTDSFLFCGFPPKKSQKQAQALEALSREKATLVFYESPKRICALISQTLKTLGDRRACLAREITKRHEEYIRGDLSEILSALENRDQIKGECALFIQGASEPKPLTEEELKKLILSRLSEKTKTGTLAKEISRTWNLPKKTVYDAILKLKSTE